MKVNIVSIATGNKIGEKIMRTLVKALILIAIVLLCEQSPARAAEPMQFRELFNGKDLSGWVNVNTDKDTWSVRDGLLVCTGRPIGVMRTEKQYENFILHIEWRHMEAGGNSGTFLWSEGTVPEGSRLPKGLEVQMLELDWPNLNNGKFVNGISKASVKKGYICLESEGAEIHFRNIRIMELPPGMAGPENSAPVVADKP